MLSTHPLLLLLKPKHQTLINSLAKQAPGCGRVGEKLPQPRREDFRKDKILYYSKIKGALA